MQRIIASIIVLAVVAVAIAQSNTPDLSQFNEEQLRAIATKLYARVAELEAQPIPPAAAKRIAELEAEVARLKAENAKLSREVDGEPKAARHAPADIKFASPERLVASLPRELKVAPGDEWTVLNLKLANQWFDEHATGGLLEIQGEVADLYLHTPGPNTADHIEVAGRRFERPCVTIRLRPKGDAAWSEVDVVYPNNDGSSLASLRRGASLTVTARILDVSAGKRIRMELEAVE